MDVDDSLSIKEKTIVWSISELGQQIILLDKVELSYALVMAIKYRVYVLFVVM
jgi:hypothetical protein